MSKEVYLAGKLSSAEGSLRSFASELEDMHHHVSVKWWELPALPTPYLDNLDTSRLAAAQMIEAASQCDVFMLFPTDNILGAAVEFGAALASAEARPDKSVIVVNPFEVRQSVFYVHPSVTAVRGLAEVRAMRWYSEDKK